MRLRQMLALLALGGLWQTVGADELRLKNGDVLSGKIVKKETANLIFHTDYAGDISIQWSAIASLKSDTPVHILLTDGSYLRGPLEESDDGNARIVLIDEEGEPEQDFELIKTRYVNPTPDLSGEGIRLTGHINAGGTLAQGNTETRNLHFDAESIARTLHNRYTLGGTFFRVEDHGRNTQFNSGGYGKFDHFFTAQWYTYANATLENDRFRDLRLRSTFGGGSGYQVFETPNLNLSLEGGLNYIIEDYYRGSDDSYPGVRWAIKYDQLFFHNTTRLFHEHEVLVGFSDTRNILVRSKTGLRFPLVYNFNATTQFNVEWDNNPSPGREKLDTVLLFTLGYGW